MREVKKPHTMGKTWKCNALLAEITNHDKQFREELSVSNIASTLDYWQFENEERCASNQRLRREYFIYMDSPKTFECRESMKITFGKAHFLPEPAELVFNAKRLHIIVLLGNKHYAYVNVNMINCNMVYWDSSSYGRVRACKKNKMDGMSVMTRIEALLNELPKEQSTKAINFKKQDENMENKPTQDNHLDCGVFALFYAECHVHKFKVKETLTRKEIENYRKRIYQIVETHKSLMDQRNIKERKKSEGEIITLE